MVLENSKILYFGEVEVKKEMRIGKKNNWKDREREREKR